MNFKEEDIYNFLKEYHPETNRKGNYSIDEISELYKIARKTHVGEFIAGDFLTYHYSYHNSDIVYTAVVIFNEHNRYENEESVLTNDCNKTYTFKTFCYCLDVFDIDCVSTVSRGDTAISIAYSTDLRYSTQEEKIALLNKIKRGLINV